MGSANELREKISFLFIGKIDLIVIENIRQLCYNYKYLGTINTDESMETGIKII